jgi:hypothetical protein
MTVTVTLCETVIGTLSMSETVTVSVTMSETVSVTMTAYDHDGTRCRRAHSYTRLIRRAVRCHTQAT